MNDEVSALAQAQQMSGDDTDASQGNPLRQMAAMSDSSDDMYGSYGRPTVSRADMDKADNHLQDVINDLIQRQQAQAVRMDPRNGISLAAKMALIGGGAGQYGSFGTSMGRGLQAAAPLVQNQEEAYQSGQNSIENLRLRAAQIEKENQARMYNSQVKSETGAQRQRDYLARHDLMIDPETGKIVSDPSLIKAKVDKEIAIAAAKKKASGEDLFEPIINPQPSAPNGASPTSNLTLPHNLAIMMAESGGNLNTPNGDGGKAVGPMQLHEEAAKEMGVTDRTNVAQNIAGGSAYLQKYNDVFKDKPNPALWATVAYNRGPGFAEKWDGNVNSLPKVAQDYVKKVDGYMGGQLLSSQFEPLAANIQVPNTPVDKAAAETPEEATINENIKNKSYRPQVESQLRALLRGDVNLTYGMAKHPFWQKMIREANEVDPNFSMSEYNARAKVKSDFKSGKAADQITSLNTAIAHLGKMYGDYQTLDNTQYPLYNKVVNSLAESGGNKKKQGTIADLDTDSIAVAHELAKVFRSSGMSEAEVKDWQEKLERNASPEASNHMIKSAVDLMDGRLNALGDRYKQGMNRSVNGVQLLNPEAQKTYEMLKNIGEKSNTEQHDELPDASKYPGKVATDTATGKKFKSDGKNWNAL